MQPLGHQELGRQDTLAEDSIFRDQLLSSSMPVSILTPDLTKPRQVFAGTGKHTYLA